MYSLIQRIASRQRDHWHTSRAELVLALMRPAPGSRVLDLGGNDGEFMARVCAHVPLDVTIADVGEPQLARARRRGFATVHVDEHRELPFADGEFDLVISNSVIEHVTARDAGNRWSEAALQRQQQFGSEIRRIAKTYFVQTPHRSFPIEAHTWLPFVGWLPHAATVKVVALSDRWWVKHCGGVDWNLLAEREMQQLFPDAALHVETSLGLPKSLIAYRHG